MKRSKSSVSIQESYPLVFQKDAYDLEKEIKIIMDSNFKINKRYIGSLVCFVIVCLILIVVLGLSFIGAFIAILLAICLVHIVKNAWKRYKLNKFINSKEKRYKVRLLCLNLYLKKLKGLKVSLEDFQGILEKIFEEFLPAFIVQIHNPELFDELNTLQKFLKSNSVHSCLLNAAIQLEISISNNNNPVMTTARLRKFFIPMMCLLKQPPGQESRELEIVTRISEILRKEETQMLLLTYPLQNDFIIKNISAFWYLAESYKSTQFACKFLADVENNLNQKNPKLSSKFIHYRRSSFDDVDPPKKNTELFKLAKNAHESFFKVVGMEESTITESKYETISHNLEKTYFSERLSDISSARPPKIIYQKIPVLFEGDMADLSWSESEKNEIEFNEESDGIKDNSIKLKFSEPSESDPNERINHRLHPYIECFDQLLAIEKEPNSEKVWKLVVNKPETKVYQKKVTDSPICMIKAFCNVSYSSMTVYKAIWDTSIRTRWDAVFNEFRLIESDHDYELLYFMIKTPFGITKRDWLQRRVEIHDYPEPGTIILHFVSIEDAEVPPKKGIIRAETLISGYIIRPTSEKTCNVMIVSQNDIKGLIPKALVNSVASKAPADWVNSMNKGCKMVMELQKAVVQ
jgi:START domain